MSRCSLVLLSQGFLCSHPLRKLRNVQPSRAQSKRIGRFAISRCPRPALATERGPIGRKKDTVGRYRDSGSMPLEFSLRGNKGITVDQFLRSIEFTKQVASFVAQTFRFNDLSSQHLKILSIILDKMSSPLATREPKVVPTDRHCELGIQHRSGIPYVARRKGHRLVTRFRDRGENSRHTDSQRV